MKFAESELSTPRSDDSDYNYLQDVVEVHSRPLSAYTNSLSRPVSAVTPAQLSTENAKCFANAPKGGGARNLKEFLKNQGDGLTEEISHISCTDSVDSVGLGISQELWYSRPHASSSRQSFVGADDEYKDASGNRHESLSFRATGLHQNENQQALVGRRPPSAAPQRRSWSAGGNSDGNAAGGWNVSLAHHSGMGRSAWSSRLNSSSGRPPSAKLRHLVPAMGSNVGDAGPGAQLPAKRPTSTTVVVTSLLGLCNDLKVSHPVVFALTTVRVLTLRHVILCNTYKDDNCAKHMEILTGPHKKGPWTSVLKFTSAQTDQQQTFAAAPDAMLLSEFVQVVVHDTYGGWASVKSLKLSGAAVNFASEPQTQRVRVGDFSHATLVVAAHEHKQRYAPRASSCIQSMSMPQ